MSLGAIATRVIARAKGMGSANSHVRGQNNPLSAGSSLVTPDADACSTLPLLSSHPKSLLEAWRPEDLWLVVIDCWAMDDQQRKSSNSDIFGL